MKNKSILLFAVLALTGCSKDDTGDNSSKDVVVIKASGDINPQLDQFRQLLGAQLNTAPGAVGGRREINWDGIHDSLLGVRLPADFFNPTAPGSPPGRQRGLTYAPGGDNFMVSKTGFAEVNPQAAASFASFSGDRAFANTTNALWEIGFEIPGQAIAANVKGFGIVFSDVDMPASTSLEFFNGNRSLGKFFVPQKGAGTNFSFLGVYFKNSERITRVQVVHDGKLSDGEKDISDNGTHDLIIMDDFLYNEPIHN
jgi:hypothetical protein